MKSIQEYMITENQYIKTQWLDGQIVCMCTGGSLTAVIGGDGLYPRELTKNDLYLAIIYINKKRRGLSLGSQLLETLCEEADKKKLNIVVYAEPLDNDTPKDRLLKFYEKFGFEQDEKIPNDKSCLIRKYTE